MVTDMAVRVTRLFILIGGFILATLSATANAHPGRTDSSGGHTCRTNCESYGLDYGEYHYHNGGGGSSTPSYAAQGRVNGAEHASKSRETIISTSENTGYSNGKLDGGKASSTVNYAAPDLPVSICNVQFTFDSGTPEDYKLGYHQAYKNSCTTIATSAYNSSYRKGYDEAYKQKQAQTKLNETNDNDEYDDSFWGTWGVLIGIAGFYGLIGGAGYLSELYDNYKSKK